MYSIFRFPCEMGDRYTTSTSASLIVSPGHYTQLFEPA